MSYASSMVHSVHQIWISVIFCETVVCLPTRASHQQWSWIPRYDTFMLLYSSCVYIMVFCASPFSRSWHTPFPGDVKSGAAECCSAHLHRYRNESLVLWLSCPYLAYLKRIGWFLMLEYDKGRGCTPSVLEASTLCVQVCTKR